MSRVSTFTVQEYQQLISLYLMYLRLASAKNQFGRFSYISSHPKYLTTMFSLFWNRNIFPLKTKSNLNRFSWSRIVNVCSEKNKLPFKNFFTARKKNNSHFNIFQSNTLINNTRLQVSFHIKNMENYKYIFSFAQKFYSLHCFLYRLSY